MTGTADDDDEYNGSFLRPVVEGEILRKTGVQKLNRLMLPDAERSLTRDNNYLLCIDEKDCELFIPVAQTGLFYEVSDGQFDKTDNRVVQISDILDEMVEMPVYVRHILGDPPPISKFYSPCLKLVRVKEEETVMGSTLDTDEDALPLEIQTNSPIKFEISLNTPMLQSCMEYTEAVDMCSSVGQNYVTDMKLAVTFKVVPDEPYSIETVSHANPSFVAEENESQFSVSNSQRTSTSAGHGSELGEVDANSEFSIKWDPDAKTTARKYLVNSNDVNMPESDCVSIESVDYEQANKLNSVLGGPYFDTEAHTENKSESPLTQTSNTLVEHWIKRRYSDTDINEGLKSEKSVNSLRGIRNDTEIIPFVDVVEEVTDFSIYSTLNVDDSESGPSTSTTILGPPSPFKDGLGSMPSSVTISSSTMHSSTATVESTCSRSQVDLSDHFPSIHSSASNLSEDDYIAANNSSHGQYVFTGDVYISPETSSSHESLDRTFSSRESIDGSWESWNKNKFKIVRSKDIPRNNRTSIDGRVIDHESIFMRASLSDDLMQLNGHSKTSSANSIITCKVADEMVSSCNDLRLSLGEITRNAHDNHMECSWREFCLERSSSLPVRSKHSPRQKMNQTDEHSQSWEQISPRKNDTSSNVSTPRNLDSTTTKHTLNKLNVEFSDSFGDKAQLISDTSSENSAHHSHRSLGSVEDDNNTSFALSESSDMSVTDGPESVLAAIAEMDMYLDSDSTDSRSSTRSYNKITGVQKIKINNAIKRKQLGEWNDIVEVI